MLELEQWIKPLVRNSALPGILLGLLWLIRGKSFSVLAGLVWGLLLCSFLADRINLYLAATYQNNMPGFHVYGFLEFAGVGAFFWKAKDKPAFWFRALYVGFMVYYVVNSIFFEGIFTFNQQARLISRSIQLFLSVHFFLWYIRELENDPIRDGRFWVSAGILIYCSVAFFSNLMFFDIMIFTEDWMTWMFHNMSNIVRNLFLAVGLWFLLTASSSSPGGVHNGGVD